MEDLLNSDFRISFLFAIIFFFSSFPYLLKEIFKIKLAYHTSNLFFLFGCLLGILIFFFDPQITVKSFDSVLLADINEKILSVFILFLMSLSLFNISNNALYKNQRHEEFCILIGVVSLLFISILFSQDIFFIFIGLELFGILSYFLLKHIHDSVNLKDTLWELSILEVISFTSFAIACLFILTEFGTTNLSLISSDEFNDSTKDLYTNLAFLLLFISIFMKIHFFPFHSKFCSLSCKAPSNLVAILSVGVQIPVFFFLFKISSTGILKDSPHLFNIFSWITGLGILYFAIKSFFTQNFFLKISYINRFFQTVLFIFLFNFSLNPDDTQLAGHFLYSLIYYSFLFLGLYNVISNFQKPKQSFILLEDLKSFFKSDVFICSSLVMFLFLLCGFPPGPGMITYFFLFGGLVETDQYWLSFICVLSFCIIITAMISILSKIFESGGYKILSVKPKIFTVLSSYLILVLLLSMFFFLDSFIFDLSKSFVFASR